jgi:Zn-dependent protease
MIACGQCGQAVAPDALACPQCKTLVHAAELEDLKTQALFHEAAGRFGLARDAWMRTLARLPPDTTQAEWVRVHVHQIDDLPAPEAAAAPSAAPRWLARLGPLAPILIVLFKGKGLLALFNAKSLITLGAFMGVYAQSFGAAFGVGFALLILVHELGHYVDIRRRGLPADMPVFLPGLGAYVRWRAMGVSSVVRAEVSLAGPLAGALAAVACAAIWWTTGSPIWAALARTSAWLNVFNLIPIWALDGGQAFGAFDRTDRVVIVSLCLVLLLLLHEPVFFLVAAGAIYRLFTKDLAGVAGRPTMAYMSLVLISLGLIMRLMPGEGAGLP